MKKAREFWLSNERIINRTLLLGDEIGDDADNVIYGPGDLRVIEKQAYEDLKAQAEALAGALEDCTFQKRDSRLNGARSPEILREV